VDGDGGGAGEGEAGDYGEHLIGYDGRGGKYARGNLAFCRWKVFLEPFDEGVLDCSVGARVTAEAPL
jgi:hypothetical protein